MADKNKNRTLLLILLLFICLVFISILFMPIAHAQITDPDIKFTSSLNPVGSGARALAMGGAFIAVADDATAASWNPAGLKHLLKPEVSVVANYEGRREGFSYQYNPGASNRYRISGYHLNYLSVAYPFMWMERNFVVSLNYQNLYSLDRRMQYVWHYQSPGGIMDLDYQVNYKQRGNLKALSPALAVFLTERLFLGATFNFWSDQLFDNGWIEEYHKTGQGLAGGRQVQDITEVWDRYTFNGFNMNLGVLWDINPHFSLGAVLKTPFTAKLEHEQKKLVHMIYPEDPQNNTVYYVPSQKDDQRLEMPMAYGIGLAVKPTDRLVFDLDVYRIDWDDFILRDAYGNESDPVTGLPKGQSPLKPTYHVRLGAEYVFLLKKMTLTPRMGLFSDPEPASGNPDDFFGFGLGVGLTFGSFAIDWAYQYRFGENVEGDSIRGEKSPADVKQHLFYNSFIYYF